MPDRHHALAKCEDCPLLAESSYVESCGPKDAELAIVGESPGYKEVRANEPFVGPSGRLLNIVLKEHGINRSEALLTNTVSCRPPENRNPSKLEIKCCQPRLESEIGTARKILALGKVAANAIFGGSGSITSLRVGPPRRSTLYPNAAVTATYHPAFCLRSADGFPSFQGDIAKIRGARILDWKEPSYVVY